MGIFHCCLLLGVFCGSVSSFHCISAQGSPVNWFLVYKVPKRLCKEGFRENDKTGTKYAYMDSQGTTSWNWPPGNIMSSPVSETLQQLPSEEESDTKTMFLVYNDASERRGFGHTKGVVAFNSESSGIWIIHSAPHFYSGLQFPENAKMYGQIFLCISMRVSTIESLIAHLWLIKPYVLRSYVGENFFEGETSSEILSARLNLIRNNERNVGLNSTSINWEFEDVEGQKFFVFSKPRRHRIDIYEYVATNLTGTLQVQSWRSGGGGPLPDNTDVENIERIKLTPYDSWRYTQDHSKWAVSRSGGYVCIGDLNRMESQKKRGGGVLCFKNYRVAQSFLEMEMKEKENYGERYQENGPEYYAERLPENGPMQRPAPGSRPAKRARKDPFSGKKRC